MCDTVVIVEQGRVLFAKNSDRDPNESQGLEWHPRRTFPAGTAVRCTWIEIPQVRETHATLLSRPFWMWGAEMGANEHGVVIGNEAVFTRQPYAKSGLTGMDLLRLALERASSAEAACALIIEMLETHGQGGGCAYKNPRFTYHNSFLAADPQHAFVLETAGKHYSLQRVTGVRSISNYLTLPDFAEKHTDTLKTAVACGRVRRQRTEFLAQRAHSAGDLFQLLRDHGPDLDGPRYHFLNGGMSAICMHAGGVAANAQTTASWVAELAPGKIQHWVTATAAPCLSLFKPVSVNLPVELDPPAQEYPSEAFWWRQERLNRLVMHSPQKLLPLFAAQRDALESVWLQNPPDAQAAFDEHARLIGEWASRIQTQPSHDTRPWWTRLYWNRKNKACGI
ncbi:MAG TPA: carcinine hydrolase/isopenicillin-N N-acyltransferase family protein [Candidatus Hydrogenedentes bacterium]|nr:carcinine hydrolase/isopenicillin-N N-acyltransferase family protein [Candidatus Hydrogenedentota bacterium]